MPTVPDRHLALTPDALAMMDAIARTGSFAAAARELGKVPSALTYSVRQLEEALDVLLFDRRSRQARLTAAGEELLHEGRRLLAGMEGVANRVRRVATGWETQLTIAVDDVLSRSALFDLCEAFFALRPDGRHPPPTRLRVRTEVMAGTWECLLTGAADLALGALGDTLAPADVQTRAVGDMAFVFAVAPHHPLATCPEPIADAELLRHRAVAVADSAQRLSPRTVHLLPGQEVFTVASGQAKLEALLRGLGYGFLPEPMVRPHIEAGRLVARRVQRAPHAARFGYAWRVGAGTRHPPQGMALQWWLQQLESTATRRALLSADPASQAN